MCDEYKFIREFVDANPDIKKAHLETFLAKKYYNYFYTYKRVANEHKIDFLKRFSEEFNDSYKKGEFGEGMLTQHDMSILKRIMADPEKFYYDDTVWELNMEHIKYSDRYAAIMTEREKKNGKKH